MQATINEAELLQAAQAGDKDAFGSIVERYQTLVCAVTYSGTGDFGKSRQLARETFVRAFQSLPQLRDPNKFRLMLCRIARNLVDRSMRRRRFEVICEAGSEAAPQVDPGEIPISKDRQDLVWQAVATIPENYREPMIFFYQRQASDSAVAGDLDLSEPALIESVSKARSLLKSEVASLVQDVLAKTAPGKNFAIAVREGLAKAVEASRIVRPERLVVRAESAGVQRAQDDAELEYEHLLAPAPMSKSAVYGAFAGSIFGGIAWLLPTSIMAKDWPAAVVVLLAAGVIFLVSATCCFPNQTKRWRILGSVAMVLCVLNLAVINLRWNRWMHTYEENPTYNAPTDFSRWTMNLIIASIMALVLLIFLALDRRERKQPLEPQQP